jgi:hypothetical protein
VTALVCPDEEESYLLALFDAPDGLDLAETFWTDPESSDGLYRAWDVQWSWYLCADTYQAEQGARATGKTVGITMRAFALPFNHVGAKMLVTAPELNHLRPLTDAIENRIMSSRLTRELLPSGKGQGMNRQPHWSCRFVNGTQIISRLPNKDGKGVKGQHVMFIELDEAQDYPLAGWVEIVETLNRFAPGAMWRCHGVPKGTRDRFFEITQGSRSDDEHRWTVHRPMAMHRPTWGPEERNEKISEYGGSRQAIDYKRNIYGEHGDASNSVFVLSRLMAIVDTDEGSVYNSEVYSAVHLSWERLPKDVSDETRQASLLAYIDLPRTHLTGYSQRVDGREVGAPKGYSAYWGGADIGVTNHPSEFLIFGQRTGTDVLELLTRLNLQRINTDDQKAVIVFLFQFYGPTLKAFAMDKTGVGFPIHDQLSRHPLYGHRIYGYGFSEHVPVAFEERPLTGKETPADLVITRNVVEASTDWLRNDYVDARKLRLPYDREVLLEFQGQVYSLIKDSGTPYGSKRVFGGGSFHSLDAAKMAIAGKNVPPILEAVERGRRRVQEPVLDQFVGM